MPRVQKPPEGSWTAHYPELGTAPLSYEDSISPEFYELEKDAIFKRSWLNVGRVEQLPRKGSYFTKELAFANTSVVIVRDMSGEVRAFHNICRHRGNKLVWTDFPREESSGSCRQFVCKYHGWKYELDGACSFVQQEEEFFDLDKADYGLVPVHCDVWSGFIFVHVGEPAQSLHEFLGPMITALDGYPFDKQTERFSYRATVNSNWKLFIDAFQEFYHAPVLHAKQSPISLRPEVQAAGFEALHYDRRPAMADAAGDVETDGGCDAQRIVWSLGRAGSRRAARGFESGEHEALGLGLVSAVAELRDPDLGARLVSDVPLLADVV
jgi:Rieske 2Fe-2S family protein